MSRTLLALPLVAALLLGGCTRTPTAPARHPDAVRAAAGTDSTGAGSVDPEGVDPGSTDTFSFGTSSPPASTSTGSSTAPTQPPAPPR